MKDFICYDFAVCVFFYCLEINVGGKSYIFNYLLTVFPFQRARYRNK